MVDWTILTPTFLTAVVEWTVTVVTVLAIGPGDSTTLDDAKKTKFAVIYRAGGESRHTCNSRRHHIRHYISLVNNGNGTERRIA